MVERNVTVTSKAGLHARPIALIAATIKDYPGTAELLWGGRRARLDNMLELLAMAIPAGAALTIAVSGPDEVRIADELAMIIMTMEETEGELEG